MTALGAGTPRPPWLPPGTVWIEPGPAPALPTGVPPFPVTNLPQPVPKPGTPLWPRGGSIIIFPGGVDRWGNPIPPVISGGPWGNMPQEIPGWDPSKPLPSPPDNPTFNPPPRPWKPNPTLIIEDPPPRPVTPRPVTPRPPAPSPPAPPTPGPKFPRVVKGIGIGIIRGAPLAVAGKLVDDLAQASCQNSVNEAVGGLLDSQNGANLLSDYAGQAAQNARGGSDNSGMPPGCAAELAALADALQAISDTAAALSLAAAAVQGQLQGVDCSGSPLLQGYYGMTAEAARLAARLSELIDKYNALNAQLAAALARCRRKVAPGTVLGI